MNNILNRSSNRLNSQLRKISIETGVLNNNKASCLIKFGNTHVICSATVENSVPRFLKGQGTGWLTAEYSMIPRATKDRVMRESKSGRVSGRTQEIERLIGRSLRTSIDLSILGERQIIIDCDVINADGGTRTASISGGYVALSLAIKDLMENRILRKNPMINKVAAISCGIYNGHVIVDLDYLEDSNAQVDANFVANNLGQLIEVQATAEKQAFTQEEFNKMLELANQSIQDIFKLQDTVLS